MTVLNAPTQALAAGDRTPNFVLPDASGKFSMFYDRVTGRPTVLLVAPSFHPPVLPSALLGRGLCLHQIKSSVAVHIASVEDCWLLH